MILLTRVYRNQYQFAWNYFLSWRKILRQVELIIQLNSRRNWKIFLPVTRQDRFFQAIFSSWWHYVNKSWILYDTLKTRQKRWLPAEFQNPSPQRLHNSGIKYGVVCFVSSQVWLVKRSAKHNSGTFPPTRLGPGDPPVSGQCVMEQDKRRNGWRRMWKDLALEQLGMPTTDRSLGTPARLPDKDLLGKNTFFSYSLMEFFTHGLPSWYFGL
jgi:hypothetical protein